MGTHALLTTWDAWQVAQALSDRTITARHETIDRLLSTSGLGPLELTADAIMQFVGAPGLKPSTRATYHATIRAYCDWLIRTGHREDDPTRRTPRPRRPRGRRGRGVVRVGSSSRWPVRINQSQ